MMRPAEGSLTSGFAALARDPAPDRRLAALTLAIGLWRQADGGRRRVLESAAVAILAGLDYFARAEFVDDLRTAPEVPEAVLAFLGRHDPTLCFGLAADSAAAAT